MRVTRHARRRVPRGPRTRVSDLKAAAICLLTELKQVNKKGWDVPVLFIGLFKDVLKLDALLLVSALILFAGR
jgi:hypothetical protein